MNGMATADPGRLTIDGKPTKAAVVSNRNGYFYAIDRSDGHFIYAIPLVEGHQLGLGARRHDRETHGQHGHEAQIRRDEGPARSSPASKGGTNWFPRPMTPDPRHVFFVAVNQWGMGLQAWEKKKLAYKPGDLYMGVDYQMYRMGDTIGHFSRASTSPTRRWSGFPSPLPMSPACWRRRAASVHRRTSAATLMAFDAKTRKVLWKFQTGSGINASPITYELDGHQYWPCCPAWGAIPASTTRRPRRHALGVSSVNGSAQETAKYNQEVIPTALPEYKP